MTTIIEKIKTIPNLYHTNGCTTRQIKEAQNDLNLEFSDEYIDYLKEYGAISFYATEWTGLNVGEYINVVDVTKQERSLNKNFPRNYFVIENQGIEGILIISNEKGQVFSLQYDKKEYICDSLSEYLDICMKRKNN